MPSISVPAMVAAGVTGVATLASGAMQSSAASHAADVQANAAKNAQQLQAQEFQQTQQNLSPWMQTGQSALGALSNMFGLTPGPGGAGGTGMPNTGAMLSALQNYPGYQFALQQGDQSLDRVAASRGLALSGAQLKDSQQFGQGLATSTFGNYVSGLQGLSNQGLGAAGNLGTFGQNYANSSGQMGLSAAQAQAAGIVGSTNAITSGLQGALGNSLFAYNAFNQPIGAPTSPLSTVPMSSPDYSGVSSLGNMMGGFTSDPGFIPVT